MEIKSNSGSNIDRVMCNSKGRRSCNSYSSRSTKNILPVVAGEIYACTNTTGKWIYKNAVRHGNATWFPDWLFFSRLKKALHFVKQQRNNHALPVQVFKKIRITTSGQCQLEAAMRS